MRIMVGAVTGGPGLDGAEDHAAVVAKLKRALMDGGSDLGVAEPKASIEAKEDFTKDSGTQSMHHRCYHEDPYVEYPRGGQALISINL